MSTLKITNNVYVTVRTYKDGKQVIRFRHKQHSSEFTVICELENQVPTTMYHLTKLYDEIKLQWKESRNAREFNDVLSFIKRCNSNTVLTFTKINLMTAKNKFTDNQTQQLINLITTKLRGLK